MYRIYIALILVLLLFAQPAFSYWVWTPKSGKWENPKYAAKDTPEEQLGFALEAYEAGKSKTPLREFKKLLKYYPLSKEAPNAQYHIGRIMEELGNPLEAFKAYQKVIDLYPYTELVDDVIEREFKIADKFFDGEKLKLLGPLEVSARDKAIEIFKTVADNAPYGKYADQAIFKAGLIYKEISDFDSAILLFKDLLDKYPNSELVDSARYQLASCSKRISLDSDYDQTPTIVAREEFEDFIEKHPKSEMVKEAKEIVDKLKNKEAKNAYEIAEFYEERRQFSSAIIYYQDVIQEYPGTEWAQKAQERVDELDKE